MEISGSAILQAAAYLVSIGSLGAYLKTRLDNLTEQVKKQNGSISEIQKWQLHHTETKHSKEES